MDASVSVGTQSEKVAGPALIIQGRQPVRVVDSVPDSWAKGLVNQYKTAAPSVFLHHCQSSCFRYPGFSPKTAAMDLLSKCVSPALLKGELKRSLQNAR